MMGEDNSWSGQFSRLATTMGKKKPYDGVNAKAKASGKGKLSVSDMLANMESEPDNSKKAAPNPNKSKPKAGAKQSPYIDGIDLPSSDEDDDIDIEEGKKQNEIHQNPSRQSRSVSKS